MGPSFANGSAEAAAVLEVPRVTKATFPPGKPMPPCMTIDI